jgi:predicted short-subunit dehydrogenase-like oxidoreductase (DUF2520 family)
VERFPGTFCFCEGDAAAVEALLHLAADLGGKGVRMSSQGKLLYHASAVMASNYFTALLDAALATAEQAEIPRDEALAALEPLVRATLANNFKVGPAAALTGPIARGDVGLVGRQYARLRQASPELAEVYRGMGLWTIGLAVRKSSIDAARAEQLRRVLA